MNSKLNDYLVKLVDSPRDWKIVSSMFTPDHPSLENASHRSWMSRNQHRHANREAMIGVSGEFLYGFNGKIYPCDQKTIFLFNDNETHDTLYPEYTDNAENMWINFQGNKLIASLARINKGKHTAIFPSSVLSISDRGKSFVSVWDQIISERNLPDALIKRKLIATVTLLLFEIFERGFQRSPKDRNPRERRDELIDYIKTYIENNLRHGPSLDYIAKVAGYSKYHFIRLFKEHTGMTVSQYIDQCRLKKVDKMLADGHLKKEIAPEIGLSTPIAFSNWLKNSRKHSK